MSRRSVYRHENRYGVVRQTVAKRINLAAATVAFAKVFDQAGRFIKTISITRNGDGIDGAAQMAGEVGGKVWTWKQSPSKRDFSRFKNGMGVNMWSGIC